MSEESGRKERRRYRRLAISAVVRYAPRQFGSNVPPDLWEGKTINVSRSGAALELPHRLRRGGLVELSLIRSNPPRCVSVVGEVVRCERVPDAEAGNEDSSPRARYQTAVAFTRTLDIEELSTLRETHPLDATEVQHKRSRDTSSSADAG